MQAPVLGRGDGVGGGAAGAAGALPGDQPAAAGGVPHEPTDVEVARARHAVEGVVQLVEGLPVLPLLDAPVEGEVGQGAGGVVEEPVDGAGVHGLGVVGQHVVREGRVEAHLDVAVLQDVLEQLRVPAGGRARTDTHAARVVLRGTHRPSGGLCHGGARARARQHGTQGVGTLSTPGGGEVDAALWLDLPSPKRLS